MRLRYLLCFVMIGSTAPAHAQYYGNVTANPYMPRSYVAPPPMGYANPYGNSSNSPGLYDSQGGFHGNLNANPYDLNSVANPYGQYGSRYSAQSPNNPYGAGNPYSQGSPTNPYGTGMRVCGPAGCD